MSRERIPVGPFLEWFDRRVEQVRREHDVLAAVSSSDPVGAQARVLAEIGWDAENGARLIYRWRHEVADGLVDRARIEDALDHAGVGFWEIYPDLEETSAADEKYCPGCHELVTAIDGICPWCDTAVTDELPTRGYCVAEDAMRFPAVDGNCWKCGGELRGDIPRAECECGCGRLVRRFDQYGRPRRYARGHYSRKQRRQIDLPAEPFRAWLEQQLRELDPIQALARRTGLPRDELLSILERREETVPLHQVRRVLWITAREGQGKGMPPRPGSAQLVDLYPGYVRSKVCPGCGNGKSPHAQLCKVCRRRVTQLQGRMHGTRENSVTAEIVQNARNIVLSEGVSIIEAARRLQGRTRCGNVESLANELRAQFRKRGWSYPGQTTRSEAA